MSTETRATASINGRPNAAPAVIRPTNLADQQLPGGILRILPAWILSIGVHLILVIIFLFVVLTSGGSASGDMQQVSNDGQIDDTTTVQADLTETEVGIDKTAGKTNYDVPLIADVSVPGKVDPGGSIGIPGAPDGPAMTIAPPPGIGRGSGGAILDPTKIGSGSPIGQVGGYLGGVYVPGGFNGRGGVTRERMVKEGGGTGESEAAVGQGLQWLAMHQSSNGSWSLDKFHQHAHEVGGGPSSKEFRCDCAGQGQSNDIAGTAFGVLPFLGAGQTHQPPKDKPAVDYHKTVRAAIDFLLSKEKSDGDFGGGMYAQGLATIALCECYALTADAKLKPAAQHAIDFIKHAQHEAGGGWRYKPNEAGDTSVVGWQVMALKSGQLAGLNVPKE